MLKYPSVGRGGGGGGVAVLTSIYKWLNQFGFKYFSKFPFFSCYLVCHKLF